MKKFLAALVVIEIVAVAGLAPAWGQDAKKVSFSLNAGVQTNIFNGSSFDKALFTADARVGLGLGRSLELSPEVMVVFNYLSMFWDEVSGGTLVYPGVLLNFRAGKFFVGGGAVLPWAFFKGESDTDSLAPKVNVGWRSGSLQLTAYYLCWTGDGLDLFDAGFAGITLGFRF